EEDEAEQHEPRSAGQHAQRRRQDGEQQRLEREETEPAGPALPPDDGEGHDESSERQETGGRGHGTRNTAVTDRRASANEPASSSGTRKSRSLATMVSRTARPTVSTASLPARARSPSTIGTGATRSGTPHGKNRFASSVRKTKSFIAPAHSTRARARPEYSSTIASWIIVSSRCVAGLSTGRRPVSASITMKKAAKARRWPGLGAHRRAP